MAKITDIQKKSLQKIYDDLTRNFLKFELLMNEAGQLENSTWNNMSGTLSLAIDELENCLDE